MKLNNKPIKVKTKDALSSPIEKSFRMAHDNNSVIALFESNGETWTTGKLFCATTEQECLAEMTRLNLKYTPGIIENLAAMIEKAEVVK